MNEHVLLIIWNDDVYEKIFQAMAALGYNPERLYRYSTAEQTAILNSNYDIALVQADPERQEALLHITGQLFKTIPVIGVLDSSAGAPLHFVNTHFVLQQSAISSRLLEHGIAAARKIYAEADLLPAADFASDDSLYKELFRHNPLPMWVFDADTLRFLIVNNAAIAKYGYSEEEFLSMSILDIRPPEEIPLLLDDVQFKITRDAWKHKKKIRNSFLSEFSLMTYR